MVMSPIAKANIFFALLLFRALPITPPGTDFTRDDDAGGALRIFASFGFMKAAGLGLFHADGAMR